MKVQRIRDPLHNLIEFSGQDFEQKMWDIIQTPPFQRLRRVKQLTSGTDRSVMPSKRSGSALACGSQTTRR
ncbi:hypothetical protein AUP44_21440 [Tistrella mobilis]|uniref:Uncharacterized protein n=1 Tax=Tistrella mobilis TaxID=171437 RepID=A0A162LTU0_9PROT|nr:hypothetical protein AUP44_21440 [Tistrella mobilis]